MQQYWQWQHHAFQQKRPNLLLSSWRCSSCVWPPCQWGINQSLSICSESGSSEKWKFIACTGNVISNLFCFFKKIRSKYCLTKMWMFWFLYLDDSTDDTFSHRMEIWKHLPSFKDSEVWWYHTHPSKSMLNWLGSVFPRHQREIGVGSLVWYDEAKQATFHTWKYF